MKDWPLSDLFEYDPICILRWKTGIKKGRPAGSKAGNGRFLL